MRVLVSTDLESAVAEVVAAEQVKVLLFDRHLNGGYDVGGVVRATQSRSFVGYALPEWMFEPPKGEFLVGKLSDRTEPLPQMMDFLLAEPFPADEIVQLVARYDRGEGGPPPGWTGWYNEAEAWIGFRPTAYSTAMEEQAWIFDLMIEEMRGRLPSSNFDAWLEMIKPGMEERLQRIQSWHDEYRST